MLHLHTRQKKPLNLKDYCDKLGIPHVCRHKHTPHSKLTYCHLNARMKHRAVTPACRPSVKETGSRDRWDKERKKRRLQHKNRFFLSCPFFLILIWFEIFKRVPRWQMITHFKEIKHFQEASLLLSNHLCFSPTFLVFRQMLLVGFPSKLTISHAVQDCAVNTTADVKKQKQNPPKKTHSCLTCISCISII